MTQDEIIEMARQAGFEDFDKWCEHYPQETQRWCQRMEAFVKLVEQRKVNQIADVCSKLPFGDTAASFAVWIKDQA